MIRVTLRQFRTEAVIGLGLLVAFAILLAVTGAHLAHVNAAFLGTFRFAWTQSVTRKRWLAAKFGVVGLLAMVLGGLLTWMYDWWASPIDAVNQDRFGLVSFGFHGIAPIGYAAFAFALGATAGALLRRSTGAMAITVVGFVAARLAVTFWVRPNFASPLRKTLPLTAGSGPGFSIGASGIGTSTATSVTPPSLCEHPQRLGVLGRSG